MSEENVSLVRGLYDAFNRRDFDAVLSVFAENIDWYEAEGMPFGGGYQRGPQAVAENVLGPMTTVIDNLRITMDEVYAGGDEVVTITSGTGTAHESGKELRVQVAHAWTVRDGKIVRFRQFIDTVKYNEVIAV
jgi:ketosteroid isomerase-like protein